MASVEVGLHEIRRMDAASEKTEARGVEGREVRQRCGE
jgi:hypothetical protein